MNEIGDDLAGEDYQTKINEMQTARKVKREYVKRLKGYTKEIKKLKETLKDAPRDGKSIV